MDGSMKSKCKHVNAKKDMKVIMLNISMVSIKTNSFKAYRCCHGKTSRTEDQDLLY